MNIRKFKIKSEAKQKLDFLGTEVVYQPYPGSDDLHGVTFILHPNGGYVAIMDETDPDDTLPDDYDPDDGEYSDPEDPNSPEIGFIPFDDCVFPFKLS
jgi:hypothetical protein